MGEGLEEHQTGAPLSLQMFQRIHHSEGDGTAARKKHILYTFDSDATNLLENNTKLTQILLADMGLCFLSLAVNRNFLSIAYALL